MYVKAFCANLLCSCRERSRSEVSLFATTILIADGVGNDMMDFLVMGSRKVL